MNSLQIEKYLSTLPVQNFGVYAADLIPTRISPSTALVVNTDPHNEGGVHWVAFYLNGGGQQIEYFDSFGLPPHLPFYQGFLRRNARRYLYNERRLQGADSSVCAQYCLTYLYCRTHFDMTMMDFVQLFDDDDDDTSTGHNDALIRRLFTHMYAK